MARSVSNHEWNLTRSAVDGRATLARSQQQRLFRVAQALSKGDEELAAEYVADGAPLDQPLLIDEEQGGVPGAKSLLPPDWPPENKPATLLALAAWRNHMPQVDWLLRQGASPDITMADGRDAAWFASDNKAIPAYRLLMERGVSSRLRLSDGSRCTRLMGAVMSRDVEVVADLLGRKADPNARDATGKTALHHNFAHDPYDDDDVAIARMLFEFDGNPNIEDNDGVPVHALSKLEVQRALLVGHKLREVTSEVRRKLEPKEPEPEFPPGTEPDLVQIKRPQPARPRL